MYAALPPDLLKSKALGAIRTDSYGRAAVELIIGAEFTRREEDILLRHGDPDWLERTQRQLLGKMKNLQQ